MPTNHQKVKQLIESFPIGDGLFTELLQCVNAKDNKVADAKIEQWFRNCIQTLFYDVNTTVLILEGEPATGKTEFFRRIFAPLKQFYKEDRHPQGEDIYEMFCMNSEELWDFKTLRKHALNKQHRVEPGLLPEVDKRLCSFCGTTNYYIFNQSPSIFKVGLISINFERFNAIPKDALWGEMYKKFKP